MPGEQQDELKPSKWVNVSKERFIEILSIITKAKNDGLKTNVDVKEITLDNAESLLKSITSAKINNSEFKKKYKNIVDDVDAILEKPVLTRTQEKMVNILSLLTEIPKSKDKKPDEQRDTTDMSELESEESPEQEKNQRGQELKILTPNQILSRLRIILVQLKAGSNSEKLKNEIRQLLHSLCRSKKLTKKIYNNLINTI